MQIIKKDARVHRNSRIFFHHELDGVRRDPVYLRALMSGAILRDPLMQTRSADRPNQFGYIAVIVLRRRQM